VFQFAGLDQEVEFVPVNCTVMLAAMRNNIVKKKTFADFRTETTKKVFDDQEYEYEILDFLRPRNRLRTLTGSLPVAGSFFFAIFFSLENF
jgi:hypothetical protein